MLLWPVDLENFIFLHKTSFNFFSEIFITGLIMYLDRFGDKGLIDIQWNKGVLIKVYLFFPQYVWGTLDTTCNTGGAVFKISKL